MTDKQKKELFDKLAVIFDKEDITDDLILEDNTWDSLTMLALSAAIDEVFDRVIPVKQLAKCKVVKDILNLIEA